jgi:hypothetical protein
MLDVHWFPGVKTLNVLQEIDRMHQYTIKKTGLKALRSEKD